jgi:hypothetical protein
MNCLFAVSSKPFPPINDVTIIFCDEQIAAIEEAWEWRLSLNNKKFPTAAHSSELLTPELLDVRQQLRLGECAALAV